METETFFVIEGFDLNNPDGEKTFWIEEEAPTDRWGHIITEPGKIGILNNYINYFRGEFPTWDDAKEWITTNYNVIHLDSNIFAEPELRPWEEWFCDGWDSYYEGEKTVDEFMDNLSSLSYEDNDGNPMRVTDYTKSVKEWWEEKFNKKNEDEDEE